jgi:hypothetical protein
VHLLIVQMIAELIRNKWGFYRDFSVTEVKHVLGILNVNSFVVHDGAEDGMDLIGKEMKALLLIRYINEKIMEKARKIE